WAGRGRRRALYACIDADAPDRRRALRRTGSPLRYPPDHRVVHDGRPGEPGQPVPCHLLDRPRRGDRCRARRELPVAATARARNPLTLSSAIGWTAAEGRANGPLFRHCRPYRGAVTMARQPGGSRDSMTTNCWYRSWERTGVTEIRGFPMLKRGGGTRS